MPNEARVREIVLLPCPFCGQKPMWRSAYPDSAGPGAHLKVLACVSDDCFGPRTTAVDNDAIVQWNARAIAALPVQVPAGWKMVPVEEIHFDDLVSMAPMPSEYQKQVGEAALDRFYDGTKDASVRNACSYVFRAMLAASPPAPASQVLTEDEIQQVEVCRVYCSDGVRPSAAEALELIAIIDRITNKDAEVK